MIFRNEWRVHSCTGESDLEPVWIVDCEDEKWLERGIQRSFGGFHDQRCRVPIFRPSPSPDFLVAATKWFSGLRRIGQDWQRKDFDPFYWRQQKELKRVGKSEKVKMEYKRRFMAREAMLSPSCTSSPAKCPTRDLRIDMIHSTGDLWQ